MKRMTKACASLGGEAEIVSVLKFSFRDVQNYFHYKAKGD
jgi:hypothetical protein